VPPIYVSGYLKGQFLLDLYLLEQAIRYDDHQEKWKSIKKAKKSGKRALKNAAKYAFDRIEIFRLMGNYYWFAGSQTKAIEFWSQSIKTAEHSGANFQRAKTYMEVGKRLGEKKNRFEKVMGMTADDYLKKAKSLFEKFGLEQELRELDKIITFQ
jgi:tetratricopeptide (TPR) repeat protein